MALINEDYLKLPENYLFTEITKKVNIFKVTRPGAKVIHLDSGDTSRILKSTVCAAIHRAADEMAMMTKVQSSGVRDRMATLLQQIAHTDYEANGIKVKSEEIFFNYVPRHAASDLSELLSKDNIIGLFDPSYPAYIYSNVMNGRAGEKMEDGRWSNLVYIPCNQENNFCPSLPKERLDVIYISMPNNPTGTSLTTDELKKWVKYALDTKTLIIYDASHSIYVQEKKVPKSIYEIKGAQKCAIEIRCYSKTTGFTGTNFGYTVIPEGVTAYTEMGEAVSLNKIWKRRQTSKFAGMPYLTLCTAEEIYTQDGQKELKELASRFMENAKIIRNRLQGVGLTVYGGINSPYLWVKTPKGKTSWRFFEEVLYEHSVVCTPGVGFCPGGEGFVRFSGIATREDVLEAMKRF